MAQKTLQDENSDWQLFHPNIIIGNIPKNPFDVKGDAERG